MFSKCLFTLLISLGGSLAFSQTISELTKDAELGRPEAQYALAVELSTGKSKPANEEQALVWMRRAAEQGHPEAQIWLGDRLLFRIEAKKESLQKTEEGLTWIRKAAQQGNLHAQGYLADLMLDGRYGLPKNPEQATALLLKTAEQGDAFSQFTLGSNELAKLSPAESFLWLKKFADRGKLLEPGFEVLRGFAEEAIANRYANGRGVAKDPGLARSWFEKYADRNPSNHYRIGSDYYLGSSVPKDVSEAVFWYRRGSEKGDAESSFWTVVLGLRGEVPMTKVEAYMFCYLSTQQDKSHALCAEQLTSIAKQMNPAQISEAQKKAQALLQKQ